MAFEPELAIGLASWRGSETPVSIGHELLTAAGRAATVAPTCSAGHGAMVFERLGVRGLMEVIELAARGDRWVMVVCLKPSQVAPRLVRRHLPSARRLPTGLIVRPDHLDPAVVHVDAVLQLHVALLRQRSPAAWRAIDAYRRHPTRTAAAAELGCSVQAVSQHLRGTHHHATAQTGTLLSTLLTTCRSPEG